MTEPRFRAADHIKTALAQAKAEGVPIREIIIEPKRVRLIVGEPRAGIDEAADAEARMEASMGGANGPRAN